MKRKLTALIHKFDDEWDETLPATLLAMRTSVNRTTGFTPFYLEHGREARLPVDMIAGPPPAQSNNLDRYTDKFRNQFSKAFSVVAERQNSYIMRKRSYIGRGSTRLTSMTTCGFIPTELIPVSTGNSNLFGKDHIELLSNSLTPFLMLNHMEDGLKLKSLLPLPSIGLRNVIFLTPKLIWGFPWNLQ